MTKYTLPLLMLLIGIAMAETGYIEGDYRYINAPQSGWITQSYLKQGQTLAQGEMVLALDDKNQQLAVQHAENQVAQAQAQLQQAQAKQLQTSAQVAQAQAHYNQAAAQVAQTQAQAKQSQANYDNLLTGERKATLQVYRKQKSEVQARLKLAKANLKRYQKLRKSKAVSAMDVEQAQANVDVLLAQLQKVDAELAARSQPARKNVIAAAKSGISAAKSGVNATQSAMESANATVHAANAALQAAQAAVDSASANVAAAQTALAQVQEKRNERHIRSRVSGKVTEVYRFTGEFVGMGTPLAQVLADDNRKVIFFIAEAQLNALTLGKTVTVTGDGNAHTTATISHIADHAEYTPPVLYSENNRGELVFRIEAQLNKPLPIGLPVEVTL